MVSTIGTFGSFSVDDIDAARRFYAGTLGMAVSAVGEEGPLVVHGPDGHETLIYAKPGHAPATFTVLNLSVASIDAAVDELAAKGVSFERYDGIDSDDRGIYRGEGHSVAWFTDPAGNVLSVVERS